MVGVRFCGETLTPFESTAGGGVTFPSPPELELLEPHPMVRPRVKAINSANDSLFMVVFPNLSR